MLLVKPIFHHLICLYFIHMDFYSVYNSMNLRICYYFSNAHGELREQINASRHDIIQVYYYLFIDKTMDVDII